MASLPRARKQRASAPLADQTSSLSPRGIRLPGSDAGDQKRITTPEVAIRDGANHIVVGRPINAARNPVEAAQTFLEHLSRAT